MGQTVITEMLIDFDCFSVTGDRNKCPCLLLLLQFPLYRKSIHLPLGIRHLPLPLVSIFMPISFALLGPCSSPSTAAHSSSFCLQPSSLGCPTEGYVQSSHCPGISPSLFCNQVHFSCLSSLSLAISCLQIPFFSTRWVPIMHTLSSVKGSLCQVTQTYCCWKIQERRENLGKDRPLIEVTKCWTHARKKRFHLSSP